MFTYVIILVAIVILGIPTVLVVNKYPKTRSIFIIIFFGMIVLFSYLLVVNIRKPIQFDKEKDKRMTATVEKLKDIRSIQVVFKGKYGKYTGDLDSLINFVKYDSLEIVKRIQLKEWNQDEVTIKEAIKKGILKEEKSYIPAKDSLWNEMDYPVEEMKYIPFTEKKEFTMDAGQVEASKIMVQVFECYALYEDLFVEMDEQHVINFIDQIKNNKRFEGIKVGSLEEANNNAGNWEQ
jgi:hypothetical protein